jgi:hypothetical protein
MRPRRWRWPLALTLLWGAFAYLWLVPLVRPRAQYGWGHYRLVDIYLGVPVALAAFGGAAVALCRRERRRAVALRLTAVLLSTAAALVAVDAIYVLGFQQVLGQKPDYWFDRRGIPRRNNLPDAELGFRRRPFLAWHGRENADAHVIDYRTDDHGFRNLPHRERCDVVCIGDSFTEATAVAEADTFAQRLARQSGRRVINLGRSGYGPQQELIFSGSTGWLTTPGSSSGSSLRATT